MTEKTITVDCPWGNGKRKEMWPRLAMLTCLAIEAEGFPGVGFPIEEDWSEKRYRAKTEDGWVLEVGLLHPMTNSALPEVQVDVWAPGRKGDPVTFWAKEMTQVNGRYGWRFEGTVGA